MKNIIITAIVAIIIGVGIGYFAFANKGASDMNSHEGHAHAEANATTSDETWTCSMHPQIRQNEPGICPICEMDLIPLAANTSDDPTVLQMSKNAVKLANIQTTTIGSTTNNEQGQSTMQLTGTIKADERLASSQVAHVPGRIEQLFVSFTGEQVYAGQKSATIYSPDLVSAQQELLEAVKLQSINPKLLAAARDKLRFWKIGPQTIADIEATGNIRETFTLVAEASGIVTNKRVNVGDYVQKGQAIFDLMNLNKVWVFFDAYEEDLSNYKVGMPIEFTTPSVPNKVFKTKISFIDPVIDAQSRVTVLRASIGNEKGQLKPEMLVSGTTQKQRTSSAAQLTVPKSAVMWTGKRSVVYVKVPDETIPSFKYKEVTLGDRVGEAYVVLEGLDAGDDVVTYGAFTIDAAAQLNNQRSMMNQQVAIKKDTELAPDFTAETPSLFKQQLNELANAYIMLKDAFVATDATKASADAALVAKALTKVNMSLLKGDAHIYWMELQSVIEGHTQKIMDLEEVEAQRKQFGFLSDALIDAIESYGVEGDALYVQYCPMAFDNQGGDWLAKEEAVRNPYFGDKMMKCGLVKATF